MTAPLAAPLRVAVLGGTGFIGRVLCARLVEQGHEVLSLARSVPADPPAGRFTSVDLSTTAPVELARLLDEERIDAVVNAAGGMWGLTDEQMYEANVVLVGRLVEAVAAMTAPARLVHLGTVHEYGMAPIGTSQRESDAPAPVMEYGKLKLAATESVTRAVEAGLVRGVTLRLGNVVGAGQPGHSLLGVMAAKLDGARLAGEPARLDLQPLTAQRDFVDLTDTVDAVLAAIATPTTAPVINVGTGSATAARVLVDLLIEVSGVPVEVTEVPAPAGSGPETEWQQMDTALAAEQLGWTPGRSLRQAVDSLWQARIASATS
ncbi:NAD(P)-dependent oxidoreductase [Kitasatospora terrestris]|uniref:NAD-dependent epimerase/dehydratase family protein n=1 Tax=Kitasatospora terrestris TaxID=258051 RepID=A0ABP9DPI1_9ACTN